MNIRNYKFKRRNLIQFCLVAVMVCIAAASDVRAQSCVAPPSGLISWWQAESNALDFNGTNNATPHGGLTYAIGKVIRAFQFNGSNAYLTCPASGSLNVGAGSGFTIEGWIKPGDLSSWQPLIEWNNGTNFGVHFWLNINGSGSLYADILDTAGNDHSFNSANNLLTSTNFYHVALTFNKTTGATMIYCNGAIVATQNVGTFTPQTVYPLYFGRRPPVHGDHDYYYKGSMDEFSLYNRSLSSSEITAIYNAGAAGKCLNSPPPPPSCVTTPAGLAGWWRGESNTVDTIGTNYGILMGGVTYKAGKVGNGFAFDGNQGSGVELGTCPNLQVQNFTMEAWVSRSSTTSIGASGGGTLFGYGPGGYGIYLDSTGHPALSHAAVDAVVSTGTGIADTNFHHVAVTKSNSTVIFYVDGIPAPSATYNTAFTFTTPAAIGSEGDNLDNCFLGTIDELSLYTRSLTTAEIQSIYLAGAGGKCTDQLPPSIVFQPRNQNLAQGDILQLNVQAKGTAPFNFQWLFNGTNIAGATNAPVTVSNVQPATAGAYSVIVSNLYGSVLSSNAIVTVALSSSAGPLLNFNFGNLQLVKAGPAAIGMGPNDYWNVDASPGPVTLTGLLWSDHTPCPATLTQTATMGSFGLSTGDNMYDSYLYRQVTPATFIITNLPAGLYNFFVYGHGNDDNQNGNYQLSSGGTSYGPKATAASTLAWTSDIWQENLQYVVFSNVLVADGLPITLTCQPGASAFELINGLQIVPAGSTALVITLQPQSQTVLAGATATFTASASGSGPVNYQWRFNGTNISGATNSSLVLTNVQLNQAGSYAVRAASGTNSIVSSNALLTVNSSPTCVSPAPGLVSWWKGESNTLDQVSGNTGTYVGTSNYASGKVGGAFQFNGSSQYVRVPDAPSLHFTNMTAEAWVNPSLPSGTYAILVKYDAVSGINQCAFSFFLSEGHAYLSVSTNGTPAGTVAVQTTNSVPANQWTHVVGTYDGNTLKIYLNGALDSSVSLPGSIFPGTDTLGIGALLGGVSNGSALFNGLIDEPSLYSRALSAGEIAAIYNANAAGKCSSAVAPAITLQPQSQTVTAGNNASFNVVAAGTNPLGYQWRKNGSSIAGATNSSLALTNVLLSDSGALYSVIVSNVAGSVTSSNALLTVNPMPSPLTITLQPQSQTVFVGTTATFTAAASGNSPINYQWRFSGTNISGATNSSLVLTNVQLNQAGSYAVRVSSGTNSLLSSNALLTVNSSPTCVSPAPGLVSWWRGESNTFDVNGTNNGTVQGNLTYPPGEVGHAFQFDGSSFFTCPSSPSLAVGASNGFTVECWIQPSSATNRMPIWEWANNSTSGTHFWVSEGGNPIPGGPGCLYANLVDVNGNWHIFSSALNIITTNFQHVALTYDHASGVATLYRNGVNVGSQNLGSFTPQTTYPVYVGRRPCCNAAEIFSGLMDDVTLYNRSLSGDEIASIYNAGTAGKCFSAPPPPPPSCVNAPAGLASWWRGESNTFDSIGTNFGILMGGTTYTSSEVGSGFTFDGNQGSGVQLGMCPSLQLQNFTVEAWVKRSSLSALTHGSGGGGVLFCYGAGGYAFFLDPTGHPAISQTEVSAVSSTGGAVNDLNFHHVAVTKSNSTVTFYLDGVASPIVTYSPTFTFTTKAAVGAQGDNLNDSFLGTIDELSVYTRPLSNNEIQAIYNAGSAGKCINSTPPPPTCVTPSSGLISWWRGESNTVDSIGTNNGTIVGGASYGGGEVGKAFQFNGSGTYVLVPDSPNLHFTSAMTAEAWVNPSLSNGTYAILVKYDAVPGINQCAFSFFLSNGHAYFSVSTNGTPVGTVAVQSSNSVPANQWTHVAGTYDGSVLKIYLNGALDSSVSLVGSIFPGTDALGLGATIGGLSSGSGLAVFKGLIDEPSLYNRALSANEVAGIYNAGSAGKCLNSQPPPSCVSAPAGLASWWRGESNAVDSVGSNVGTLVGNTVYSSGEVGSGFKFDGNQGSGVQLGMCSNLQVQNFTMEAWVKRSSTTSIGATGGGTLFGFGVGGFGIFLDTTGLPALSHTAADSVISTGTRIADTNFHHVAVTKSNDTVMFYVDGVAAPAAAYHTTFTFNTPAAIGAQGDNLNNSFLGTIDELSLYTRPLTTAEIQSIYLAGAAGKCTDQLPPLIVTQPQGQNLVQGDTLQLSVQATGVGPLGFQWLFNSTNISGATNSTLIISNVQSANAGIYSAMVSNAFGSVLSSGAIVTVASGSASGPLLNFNFGAPQLVKTGPAAIGFGSNDYWNVDEGLSAATLTGLKWSDGTACPAVLIQNGGMGSWGFNAGDAMYDSYIYGNGGSSSFVISNLPSGLYNVLVYGHGDQDNQNGQYQLSSGGTGYGSKFTSPTRLAWTSIAWQEDLQYVVFSNVAVASGLPVTLTCLPGSSSYEMINGMQIAPVSFSSLIITLQPQSQTVFAGATATFTAAASGNGVINYQWRFNGTNISGATGSSLVLTNVQLNQAGSYAVRVSSGTNSVLSSSAVLTVNSSPTCTSPAPGLVSWWKGESNTLDQVSGNIGNYIGTPNYASGKVGGAFQLDGSSQYIRIPDAPSLHLTNLTAEAWVNLASTSDNQSIMVKYDGTLGLNQSAFSFSIVNGRGYLTLSPDGNPINGVSVLGTNLVPVNQWTHLAVTYDGAALKVYFNGALDSTTPFVGGIFPGTDDLGIGANVGGLANGIALLHGLIDEPSLYNRALSAGEIAAIYNADAAGKCASPIAPSITLQPQPQTVMAGGNASFNVAAVGTNPLNYQWRKNGSSIAGATNSSLALSNVLLSDGGALYSVIVSNIAGSAISSNALLTVNPMPSTLIISNVTATSGILKVPVNLIAQGTENTVGFSVNFDNSVLNYAGAALHAVTNATLLVNTNRIPNGSVGIAISLPLNLSVPAGTNDIVDLNFNVVPTNNDEVTSLTFGDQPIPRQVYNAAATSLSAVFNDGTETIPFLGFEGDVSPLTNGDRHLLLNDWIQVGRFVAGLDPVPNAAEFQRADCAPRATLGDGYLTVSDWVQAGRYGAALDPVTIVGGPTQDLSGGTTFKAPAPTPSPMLTSRTLTVAGGLVQAGSPYQLSVQLGAQGNENGLEFSLAFPASTFRFDSATLGAGAMNATLMLNTNRIASGKLGVVLALPTGSTFPSATIEVLKLNLLAAPTASGSNVISFLPDPLPEEVSDVSATSLPITYISKTFSVNPLPTLSVSRTGGNLSFSWPASAPGFYLESTTSLTPPHWTNAPATLSTNGNTVTATGSPSGSQVFYRLHHP